ncbi:MULTISPECIES: flavin reductase family protein [Methanosarcina]|jgi:flavin reductase (DIM6/NTAB) family NADH-FMN oxidoreductase RutF|uniref:Flavin reductase family protein n=8 Tax=Methanosarcina mazei TaxID=2209 RepID=A0A0F8FXR5_METMZ|nr:MULTISPECIES: flavin reductase family protein [Methanosarcina]AAM32612.1 flavoredoxin [Methanosarcina mazei Go1]AGF98260.1 flavoredoxin Flr [Methanosarcina mazei Tuc01]AKB40709.1 flavoredoxin Flr [Methanosarcina mazei WWM610]AKB61677.1 flavoredoxin Flr [Methanosarcina mazei SarPi]AKB64995.1 flavoredoxin Flr [Methanosarcina mazei S-6]
MKQSIGAKPLAFPTPAWVVGTYDMNGKPNAMTVAWAGICCSNPPCISVSLRKATYSYAGIVENKAFTVSIPSEVFVREADYFGIASGKDENKFECASLTPVRSELVPAPYVGEFPVVLECKLLHSLEVGLHTMFVGEIMDIKAEEYVLDENGNPDIERIKPVIYGTGNKSYYSIGRNLGKAFYIGKMS